MYYISIQADLAVLSWFSDAQAMQKTKAILVRCEIPKIFTLEINKGLMKAVSLYSHLWPPQQREGRIAHI